MSSPPPHAPPLPPEANLLFGRGFRAGIDRREQKKAAAETEADLLKRLRETTGVRETDEGEGAGAGQGGGGRRLRPGGHAGGEPLVGEAAGEDDGARLAHLQVLCCAVLCCAALGSCK